MPKDLFQFKQFSVYQKGATLKICTDSCLFGAWAACHNLSREKVLDIGSGTGLLGLMYVQQNAGSTITGIEVDEVSSALTKTNFENSPWADRLTSLHLPLQAFSQTSAVKFDAIICNPPFFENQLSSIDAKNNLAKHSIGLGKGELLDGIDKLLSEDGVVYILLPPFEAQDFIDQAKNFGLHLCNVMKVKNFQYSEPIRFMMAFGREKEKLLEEEMYIYSKEKIYSEDFIKLLKCYYLNL